MSVFGVVGGMGARKLHWGMSETTSDHFFSASLQQTQLQSDLVFAHNVCPIPMSVIRFCLMFYLPAHFVHTEVSSKTNLPT